jgi:Zn finger protein HypA/HybF involved in hydrogenase expression
MSSALMEAPTALFAGGRRATLEELLDVTWRLAQSESEAECPLCHSEMSLEGEQARCGSCGSTLF